MDREVRAVTATEWIEEGLREFPSDKILVENARKMGETDEEIKHFLEGT